MLPIYEQEQPSSCVAACVRMVLAVCGLQLTEEEIRYVADKQLLD